jgi:tripartite-type tricarboxylate transporter receptor subunit TctC
MNRKIVATTFFCMLVGAAIAQEYPAKPVRILVGFAPGGGADAITRAVSVKLGEALGQQLIVDNRPGANGMIAAESAAKAPPDGYTLLAAPANYAFAAAMDTKMPFDMGNAFAAVGQMVDAPLLVVVHPSVPAASVAQLVALAKTRPGRLAYGSGGTGGAGHLAAELFRSLARVDLLHVPYKGTGPALIDLVAGQVSICFCTIPGTLQHVKSGRLRALAVTTARRTAAAPEIPTVAEGGVPGYAMSTWYGILAPAGTPAAVVGKLSAEMSKALKLPEVRSILVAAGADPVGSSPQEFAAFFKNEIAKWTKIVRSAGIRSE